MPETAAQNMEKESVVKEKSTLREYVESVLWALVLFLVIRTCVIQSFKIPSGSMEDTLLVGDHLLVSKFIYGIKLPFSDRRILRVRAPQRGDVVVFQFPMDRSKDFVKRLIGVPGDEIEVRNKQLFVNGQLYRNPHENHKEAATLPRSEAPRDNFGPVRVPAGSYFMMGDNRDRSYDSRFWGFVKESDLEGKALVKYWSWDSEAMRVRWDRVGRLIE